MWNRIVLFLLPVVLSSTVEAHPGHHVRTSPTGVLHYLTSPEHLIQVACWLLFCGCVAALCTYCSRRSLQFRRH
jgi:hydrogenase/urease accessory protein HupE